MPASPVYYDAPSILHTVRLRASVLSGFFGLGGLLFLLIGPAFDPLAVGLLGAACVAIGLLVWARMARVSWRISVSASSVWGLNFARQRTAIDWPDVVSLDFHSAGLTLIGRTCADGRRPVLAVPRSFPSFTDLAHDLVRSAEANYVPVLVDGMMWQELDVYTFYELDEPAPVPAPRFPRRSGADGAGHHLA
jgi:hypothetical protein